MFVCTKCGSDRVLNDAWVACNDPEDVRVFDATFCEECDGPCSVKKEPT
jgi:hypothetical protein